MSESYLNAELLVSAADAINFYEMFTILSNKEMFDDVALVRLEIILPTSMWAKLTKFSISCGFEAQSYVDDLGNLMF